MKFWRKHITLEQLWALTALVGIFAFLNTHPIRPQDFWWHLAVGRDILTTGQIPAIDTVSYTAAGAPYPSYQAFWLMEVAMYGVYRLGGPALTVLLHSLTISTAYALLLWLGWRSTGSWRAAALAALFAAALGLNDWNVRPQAIAFAIAALFLLALREYHHSHKAAWLWVFPPGMALWANSHGTFPLGLLLPGLWLAEEGWLALRAGMTAGEWTLLRALRGPALTLLLAVAACALSPRGLGTFAYVSGMSQNPIIQNLVPEWAPPSFATLGGTLFLSGLLLSAAVLARSPKRPTLSQLLTFLIFGALGLKTIRISIWFGIVMAPVMAEHIAHIGGAALRRASQNPKSKIQNLLNALLAGLLLLGAGSSLPWFKALWPLPPEKAGLISAETPVDATEFLLAAQLPGPVFHAMSFGSYLFWAAQPAYPVFVDSRIELYPPEVWLDYIEISAGRCGWEERLAKYGARTLMLSPHEQPGLLAAAKQSTNWRMVYADAAATVLTLTAP